MSWAEIIIIITVGMFVLGPERIPVAVKWVGSTLKTVRTMAAGAQEQLQGEFGPELEELKRQIADLQSLKEIQELRSLRDLNPRALITKNILGDQFSGGITGILGLDQNGTTPVATGSGVAPEPEPFVPEVPDYRSPDYPTPEYSTVEYPEPEITPPTVTVNEPVDMTKHVDMTKPVDITKSVAGPAPSSDGASGGADQQPAPGPFAVASFDTDAT